MIYYVYKYWVFIFVNVSQQEYNNYKISRSFFFER